MKKILALLMFLGMVSVANATVIDVVTAGLGDQGHAGTAGDPLAAGEIIPLKVVLNNNPYMYEGTPYPAYDGYFLSSAGYELTVSSNGALEPLFVPGGPPFYIDTYKVSVHANMKDTSTFTDPYVIGNVLDFEAVANPDIGPGPVDIMWDFFVTASGAGPIVIDVDLILPTDLLGYLLVADYEMFPGETERTYRTMVQADFGSLDLYQVPEPMTIALLGLGGLGLMYRRRRA